MELERKEANSMIMLKTFLGRKEIRSVKMATEVDKAVVLDYENFKGLRLASTCEAK